jgi:hypothetical protein
MTDSIDKKVELTDVMADAASMALANTHTIVVAKVVAVGSTTIDVQPVIQRVVDGEAVDLPVFPSVPPIFLSGGESYDAHPITIDDYCLLLVSERCFDRWYEGDDNVPPIEQRMHDYSDSFALVGVFPRGAAKLIPTTIVRKGDSTVTGNWVHAGNYTLTGNKIVIGNTNSTTYSVGGIPGWTGTFATGDSRTVTVVHGLITNVA